MLGDPCSRSAHACAQAPPGRPDVPDVPEHTNARRALPAVPVVPRCMLAALSSHGTAQQRRGCVTAHRCARHDAVRCCGQHVRVPLPRLRCGRARNLRPRISLRCSGCQRRRLCRAMNLNRGWHSEYARHQPHAVQSFTCRMNVSLCDSIAMLLHPNYKRNAAAKRADSAYASVLMLHA